MQRPIWVEVCVCAGRVGVPPHTTTPLDRAITPINTLCPRQNTSGCFFLFFLFFCRGGRDPHPERRGHHETATDSRTNWAGPHGGLPPLCVRVSGLGFRVVGLGSVITARCRVVRHLSLLSLALFLSLSLSPCPYVVLKPKTRTRTCTKKHTEIVGVGVQGARIGCEEVLLVVSWARRALCHVSSSLADNLTRQWSSACTILN